MALIGGWLVQRTLRGSCSSLPSAPRSRWFRMCLGRPISKSRQRLSRERWARASHEPTPCAATSTAALPQPFFPDVSSPMAHAARASDLPSCCLLVQAQISTPASVLTVVLIVLIVLITAGYGQSHAAMLAYTMAARGNRAPSIDLPAMLAACSPAVPCQHHSGIVLAVTPPLISSRGWYWPACSSTCLCSSGRLKSRHLAGLTATRSWNRCQRLQLQPSGPALRACTPSAACHRFGPY